MYWVLPFSLFSCTDLVYIQNLVIVKSKFFAVKPMAHISKPIFICYIIIFSISKVPYIADSILPLYNKVVKS